MLVSLGIDCLQKKGYCSFLLSSVSVSVGVSKGGVEYREIFLPRQFLAVLYVAGYAATSVAVLLDFGSLELLRSLVARLCRFFRNIRGYCSRKETREEEKQSDQNKNKLYLFIFRIEEVTTIQLLSLKE